MNNKKNMVVLCYIQDISCFSRKTDSLFQLYNYTCVFYAINVNELKTFFLKLTKKLLFQNISCYLTIISRFSIWRLFIDFRRHGKGHNQVMYYQSIYLELLEWVDLGINYIQQQEPWYNYVWNTFSSKSHFKSWHCKEKIVRYKFHYEKDHISQLIWGSNRHPTPVCV